MRNLRELLLGRNWLPQKRQVMALLLVFTLIGLSGLGLVIYTRLKGLLEEQLGKNAQVAAVSLTPLVQSRLDEYLQLQGEADQQRPYYAEMKALFQEVERAGDLKFIYTERRVSEDKIAYVLDSEPIGSPDASPIGSEDDMNVLRARAYAARAPVYGPLTDDPRWGKFITGYAPLIDPQTQELVGLIGVDIKADEAFALFARVRNTIVFCILFILGLFALLSPRLVDYLLRPVLRDNLTQAWAPRCRAQLLDQEVRRAQEDHSTLAALMFDIDRFKGINDTYGHAVGDEVLRAVAESVRGCLRESDLLIRYGGDEFLVLLPGVDEERALAIASRIREGVERNRLMISATSLSVTISVGVELWSPELTAEQLVEHADASLYTSKAQGRNRVTMHPTTT